MVIDTSALIALLLAEPETLRFVEAIAAANRRLVAAPSYFETAIVMVSRSGPEAKEKVDRLMVELGIEIVPFTPDQAILAVSAYEQFGKGTGHAAGLNFGDCFSYALAKHTGEPILFKGNDFSHTDLAVAVPA
jgi:ribonuclease VapC